MGQAEHAAAQVEDVAEWALNAAGIRKLVQKDQLKANQRIAARPGGASRDARIGRGSPGAPVERRKRSGAQKELGSPVHRPDHFTRGARSGVQGISVLVPAGHGR